MDTVKTKEEISQEVLEKAAAIDDMTKHPGWKYLMEVCNMLIEREKESLANLNMDHKYYRRIGFLQMYKYFMELPGIIKDKKVREYVLHQGRLLGARTAMQSPKMFFEGIMKGNKKVREWFNESQLKLSKEKEQDFNEQNLE